MTGTTRHGPYRLLSLSGGGVRGVFQARYLARLEEQLDNPLRRSFDGIAATSTGAIVGLGIAAGIPSARLVDLYRNHSEQIFRPKPFAAIRRGPRYSAQKLEDQLKAEFGNKRISDLQCDVFIAASVADTYEGRVFTRFDREVSLVDAALASAGAPTYFPPRRLQNDERAHLDGGLWANDPTFVALQRLIHDHDIDEDDIVVLSVGTGRIPKGQSFSEISALRPLSFGTLRFLLDIVPSLQAWQHQEFVGALLHADQVVTVNPVLPEWVSLDEARRANELLPPLAESEFDRTFRKVQALVAREITYDDASHVRKKVTPTLAAGVAAAGLNTFIPARKYYLEFRDGRASITDYIAQAHRELIVVSINLMTGDALESILTTFRRMLCRPDSPVRITLSLLDPEKTHLVHAVAANLDVDGEWLRTSIERILTKIAAFRAELPREVRDYFSLYCHETLPSASAILIDPTDADGVIQLETKAYKTPTVESFGFEVAHGSDFYSSLTSAYINLIRDGRRIEVQS